MITILLLVAVILYFYLLFYRIIITDRHYKIPGSYGSIPWFGEAYDYFVDPHRFAHLRFEKYGNIFRTFICGHKIIFIKGSRAVDLIKNGIECGLSASRKAFVFDKNIYSFEPHRRMSVLFSENDYQHSIKHLNMVSAITLLSKHPIIFENLKHSVLVELNRLSEKCQQNMTAVHLFKSICMEITLSVFFKNVQDNVALAPLIDGWLQMHKTLPLSFLNMTPFDRGRRYIKDMDDLIANEVKRRALNAEVEEGDDLIDCLLVVARKRENNNINELVEKVILSDYWTFLHSLNVNVACVLVWTLVELEKHQSIREEVVTEVRNFRGDMSYEKLMSPKVLQFLESVIEEVIRFYGAVNIGCLRRTTLYDIDYEGFLMPKDSNIFFPINTLNFAESYFPESHIFEPNRFMPEGINSSTTGSFSFGMGPHACPGSIFSRSIIKLILFYFFSNFNYTLKCGQNMEMIFPRNDSGEVFAVPKDKVIFETFVKR